MFLEKTEILSFSTLQRNIRFQRMKLDYLKIQLDKNRDPETLKRLIEDYKEELLKLAYFILSFECLLKLNQIENQPVRR